MGQSVEIYNTDELEVVSAECTKADFIDAKGNDAQKFQVGWHLRPVKGAKNGFIVETETLEDMLEQQKSGKHYRMSVRDADGKVVSVGDGNLIPPTYYSVGEISSYSTLDYGEAHEDELIYNDPLFDFAQHQIVPDGTTEIKGHAFSNCWKMHSVHIPGSVKVISDSAFQGCKSLRHINVPGSVEHLGEFCFGFCDALGAVKLSSAIKAVPSCIFLDCKKLEKIVIPNGVLKVGRSAFSGCRSLRSIYIPDSVRVIESEAFKDCRSLVSLVLPRNLEKLVGGSFFDGCVQLKSLYIKSRVICPGYIGDRGINAIHDGQTVVYDVIHWAKERFKGVPALEACYYGDMYNLDKVVRKDPQQLLRRDTIGMSSLHILACNNTHGSYDMVEYVLNNAQDLISAVDGDGTTPKDLFIKSNPYLLQGIGQDSVYNIFDLIKNGISVEDMQMLHLLDPDLDMRLVEETSGLSPFMQAAVNPLCSLGLVYKLVLKDITKLCSRNAVNGCYPSTSLDGLTTESLAGWNHTLFDANTGANVGIDMDIDIDLEIEEVFNSCSLDDDTDEDYVPASEDFNSCGSDDDTDEDYVPASDSSISVGFPQQHTDGTIVTDVSGLTESTGSTSTKPPLRSTRHKAQKSFKATNINTMMELLCGREREEKRGFDKHFLAIFFPTSQYTSCSNIMCDVEFPNDLVEFMSMFDKVAVIQRNHQEVIGKGSSSCTLYVAKNLHCNIHCGIGVYGLDLMRKAAKAKVQVISNRTNFNTDLATRGSSKVPDLVVLNEKGMKMTPSFNGIDYLSLVRTTLRSFIRDGPLMGGIMSSGRGAKGSRGTILSYHFGSSYSDCNSYKRKSIGGGTDPPLYGYDNLHYNTKHNIVQFDKAMLGTMLPSMGITNAFCGGGTHRKEYNRKIQEALGVQYENDVPFTYPEAGTFIIYPSGMEYSAMEILQPHVDSFNDSKEGYNYTVCIGGTFSVNLVGDGDKKLIRMLKKLCCVSDTFQFAFVRYSRKCIGDMDNSKSIVNRQEKAFNNGNNALKRIFDMMKMVGTHLDYEHIVGMHDINVYINLFNKFMTEGSLARESKCGKGCSYVHGRIITNQLACADKNCYYSAAYDVILCLYKQYRITDWDDILSISVIFSVYCNSTALFVQAVESLLLGKYLGKKVSRIEQVQDPVKQIPKWAYILSTQLSYERSVQAKEQGYTAASTHSRSQVTGISMTLPHFDMHNARNNFAEMLQGLKVIIKGLWETLEPQLSKQSSFTKANQKLIYHECTSVLKKLKKLPGVGPFTSMCLIQFLSGIGIIPGECNFFAAVTHTKTGSYKFFHTHATVCHSTDKDRLKAYNDMLFDITSTVRDCSLNSKATMLDVENLACEEGRKNKKYDLKYHFQFRSNLTKMKAYLSSEGVTGHPGFVGGMQNFFFMRWDKVSKRMKLHMLASTITETLPPRKSGSKRFSLVPVSDFILVDGKNCCVDFVDNNVTMPFNTVSNGRKEVKFYYLHGSNVSQRDSSTSRASKRQRVHRQNKTKKL